MQAPAQWDTQSWTGYDQFVEAFRNPSQMTGDGVQLASNMSGGVILDNGVPAGTPQVNLPNAYFKPTMPEAIPVPPDDVMPVLSEVTVKASKQPDALLSDVTVLGKRELMTREDFRLSELEYRNRTETLSEFDKNIYRAQGVYDAGKGMVESGLYSFGVIGTAESRAQWALQTSAAAVQGIARLWNEPRAVFNEWRSDFMGNDPMKIRQASAPQATGVGLGVVSGLRATRGLAVKMAEMPGPVAGSRAAQLGGVKIGGDVPSKAVVYESRATGNTADSMAAHPNYVGDLPFSYKAASFQRFVQRFGDEFSAAGFDDARGFMQGSAASGVKYSTSEVLDARMGVLPSDYDVALVSPKLAQRAQELRLNVFNGPLTADEVGALGLTSAQNALTAASKYQLPVNFKIYGSAQAVFDAQKTIPFSDWMK